MESASNLHKLLKNTKLRLKNEYGWDDEFVDTAVNEYWRFLYLNKTNPKKTLVPGKVVDKVWHDHILHTRDYIDFCTKYFGEYFHHDPRDQSSDKMNDMTGTLDLYRENFGHDAPRKFWLEEVKIKVKAGQYTTTINAVAACKSGCCRCGS
jgi:hypothetical protein